MMLKLEQGSADDSYVMLLCRAEFTPRGCCAQLLNELILLSLLSVALAEPSTLAAQTTSTLRGTVTDQQHLAIVGATITLRAPMLVSGIETTSDTMGSYRIPGLQAGTYSLQVAQSGFAAKRYQDLTVTVNHLLILDVVLAISPVQEVITVSGSLALARDHHLLLWRHHPAAADRADADQRPELSRPHAIDSRRYCQSASRCGDRCRSTHPRGARRKRHLPY